MHTRLIRLPTSGFCPIPILLEIVMSFPDNKLTVRSPADLVAAVPYLLGFRPSDGSIVVIASRDRRVVFAARGDLPAPGAPASQIHAVAASLVPVLRRQQPITDLMIVGYGDEHIDPALDSVSEALAASGMPLLELLRVTGRRIFNLTCDNPDCCPSQGTPFDPTASLIAVQATAAGQVALPNRAAVAGRFAPVDGTARDRMRRATTAAITRLTAVSAAGEAAADEAGARAIRDALRTHDDGKRLTDDEVAWLTLLLRRPSVRDLAVDLTQPHDRHVTFWADITRRAEEALVPAPATLLAITAWRCGDGTLAGMAADRALQADPDYRLADLLLQTLHAGLPPTVFEQAIANARTNPSAQ
ncbi:DUF4192 domain-containing protein [Micromonospora soli]|uniref:DUF4192 domain-containing protein n=1 Tax=Micromonospora sp. NBRC 110009 TaxID=3061627 RepID=UPI002671E7A6|nr:DUF4192 domain-containing protein [Micromonospora sp. NBRC 110009]WKT98633.1 DUF4192 domain-containing protein [Micromonospora sp. NBRC 110009]